MTTKERKQLRCWIGLYILADKALLPTRCETDAGFHIDREPIYEFNYKQRGELADALVQAIRHGNPMIPAPNPEEVKRSVPVVQARMKAKSWKEVERQSIHFSIETFDDEYVVSCSKRGADGAWSREKELALEVRIPRNLGAEGIADAILEHLQSRSDLPGLPLAQSA